MDPRLKSWDELSLLKKIEKLRQKMKQNSQPKSLAQK